MSLGASLTLAQLESDPHPALAELRQREPVAWVPALDGWLVTSRALCLEVMRDPDSFTVDDPRFSTAQVVGPSMLSLDGPPHRRHREPFALEMGQPAVRRRFGESIDGLASQLVEGFRSAGRAELRTEFAGPLAAAVMVEAMDLLGVGSDEILSWYRAIVDGVNRISAGSEPLPSAASAMDALGDRVRASAGGDRLLAAAGASLQPSDLVSNAAVMLFGGIETAEGMTANAFWFLLTHPAELELAVSESSLRSNAIEESLRLEPAATRVDRFATRDISLGEAMIRRGDLVIVSLAAANRDPETFADPDRFDIRRANSRQHLTFAQGPHACVGIHLARLEALAALNAVLDNLSDLALEESASAPPRGLVFRKPPAVVATWRAS